jgi:hypothetical protein
MVKYLSLIAHLRHLCVWSQIRLTDIAFVTLPYFLNTFCQKVPDTDWILRTEKLTISIDEVRVPEAHFISKPPIAI